MRLNRTRHNNGSLHPISAEDNKRRQIYKEWTELHAQGKSVMQEHPENTIVRSAARKWLQWTFWTFLTVLFAVAAIISVLTYLFTH